MLTSLGQAGVDARADYARQMTNAIAQPKELGYLQRLDGVNAGLAEIEFRLGGFIDRLAGQGQAKGGDEPRASGLEATLSIAEQRIRSILQALGTLESAF